MAVVKHSGNGPIQGRPVKSPGYGGKNLKKGETTIKHQDGVNRRKVEFLPAKRP